MPAAAEWWVAYLQDTLARGGGDGVVRNHLYRVIAGSPWRCGGQPSPSQAVYGATKAFALAFSEALWAETRGSGIRILALCPGPVATGYFASLGDQAATTSIIYRRTANPADVVRTGLHGFDHDAMTVIPGLRTRILAQGHRLLPRTLMACMAAKMLAPSPAPGRSGNRPGNHSTPT